jgi:post-segregation antitoxin (ccd killing protein)
MRARRTAKTTEKTNRGIYLPKALDNELVAAAERDDCSISRYVARAIKAAIEAQKRRLGAEDVAA